MVAAYACAFAGQWSIIKVLQSEAGAAFKGTGEPLLSPETARTMQRALVAALSTDGLWMKAIHELRSMHGQPVLASSSKFGGDADREGRVLVGANSQLVLGGNGGEEGAAGVSREHVKDSEVGRVCQEACLGLMFGRV